MQPYPFAFKSTTYKEPSAEASNTDRAVTRIAFVDEDEEAVVELLEDNETKKNKNKISQKSEKNCRRTRKKRSQE